MKIVMTSVFIWPVASGLYKANTTNENVKTYALHYDINDLPVVTDISSSCTYNISAVDATSGTFVLYIEYAVNPATLKYKRFEVVVRDTGDATAHVFLGGRVTQVINDSREKIVIRLTQQYRRVRPTT